MMLKASALLVWLLGWLIALLSVEVSGEYAQMAVGSAGILLATVGGLAIVSRAPPRD